MREGQYALKWWESTGPGTPAVQYQYSCPATSFLEFLTLLACSHIVPVRFLPLLISFNWNKRGKHSVIAF